MSESERRFRYVSDRVLVDAGRILDPQFDDALVYLTGAQVEMLRNVSQYLDRRQTYVTNYGPGYYLCPADEDFDTILAIAADLEETLMGNPNTIWGYFDRVAETDFAISTGDALTVVESTHVPAGEVWVMNVVQSFHSDATPRSCTIAGRSAAAAVAMNFNAAQTEDEMLLWTGSIILKEDDYVRCSATNLATGETIIGTFWGYKMKVPE